MKKLLLSVSIAALTLLGIYISQSVFAQATDYTEISLDYSTGYSFSGSIFSATYTIKNNMADDIYFRIEIPVEAEIVSYTLGGEMSDNNVYFVLPSLATGTYTITGKVISNPLNELVLIGRTMDETNFLRNLDDIRFSYYSEGNVNLPQIGALSIYISDNNKFDYKNSVSFSGDFYESYARIENIGSKEIKDIELLFDSHLDLLENRTITFSCPDQTPGTNSIKIIPEGQLQYSGTFCSLNPGEYMELRIGGVLKKDITTNLVIGLTGIVLNNVDVLSSIGNFTFNILTKYTYDFTLNPVVAGYDEDIFGSLIMLKQPQISGDQIVLQIPYVYQSSIALTGVKLNISISGTDLLNRDFDIGILKVDHNTGNIIVTGIINDNYSTNTKICLDALATTPIIEQYNPKEVLGGTSSLTGDNSLTGICFSMGAIADLEINSSITSPTDLETLNSGSNVTYTIDVTNKGSLDATGIVVNYNLPSTLTSASGNNLSWNIDSISAGDTVSLPVVATINSYPASGITFISTGNVTTESREGNITNNSTSLTTTLSGLADVYVTASMSTLASFVSGTPVSYTVTYGNLGGKTADGVVITATSSPYITLNNPSINIGTLSPGSGGIINMTGILNANVEAGQYLPLGVLISTTTTQTTTANDSANLSGTVPTITGIYVDMLVSKNSNIPSYAIEAVSGNIITFTINYGNNGNTSGNNALISLAGLSGLTLTETLNGNIGNLNYPTTGQIVITAIVNSKNYVSATPIVTLTYNTNQSINKSVTITEPDSCGDRQITRTEECDTDVGVVDGFLCTPDCKLAVNVVKNSACVEYTYSTFDGGSATGSSCYTAEPIQLIQPTCPFGGIYPNCTVPTETDCRLNILDENIIIVDDRGDGSVAVECTNPDGSEGNFEIDCGNGDRIRNSQGVCEYEYDEYDNQNDYRISCQTLDGYSCDRETIFLDEGFLGYCGNGVREGYEQCDDGSRNGTSSSNCSIDCKLSDNLPACFNVNNGNISIQDGELMPFRWRLESPYDNDFVETENTRCREGNVKDVICDFVISNGYGNSTDINIRNCDTKQLGSEKIFDYFDNTYPSLKQAFGKFVIPLDNYSRSQYGEYKLSLEEINYEYCMDGDRRDVTSNRVCEVNFTVTKPYLAQKSVFGLTPKASDDINLDDYYDINGTKLIRSTDLEDIMTIDASDYEGGTQVKALARAFISKYEKLAISTTWNGRTVKKVPNQSIIIIDGGAPLIIDNSSSTEPFTIIVKNTDLIVKGDVSVNGMFLVQGGDIEFKNDNCTKTQEVKGIFVAVDGSFESDSIVNNSLSNPRCNFGGLHVKGVLIGDGINDLVSSRRSQLNGWFYGAASEASLKASRRNKIFNGAAVLIEYGPSLRDNLPPGASEFTKALEVYKK